MTTTVDANNSAGFKVTADTSGILQLQTNGTAAVTIDTSQNVGIGTSSPSQKLDVSGAIKSSGYFIGSTGTSGFAALGTTGIATDGGNFVGRSATSTFNQAGVEIYTNGSERMRIDASGNVGIGVTPTSFGAGYTVLDVYNGTTAGYILARSSTKTGQFAADGSGVRIGSRTNDYLQITTNDTERMRVLTTGNILSLSGGSTTATGTGIAFPATQSASTDANTLDDYEEGTWTPSVTAGAGSITTVTVGGQYRKIGSLVVAQFQYVISNNGTGSSAIYVGGLPFAGTVNTSACTIREIAVSGVTGAGYLQATTTLLLVTYNNGYPGGASWNVVGTVCYQTT